MGSIEHLYCSMVANASIAVKTCNIQKKDLVDIRRQDNMTSSENAKTLRFYLYLSV